MKTLAFLLASFLSLSGLSLGQACAPDQVWPDLSGWVCAIDNEMFSRDQNSPFERKISLISDPEQIKSLVSELQILDEYECRKFATESLDGALLRILRHQEIRSNRVSNQTNLATGEIRTKMTAPFLASCEVQRLIEGQSRQEYHQFYYLKFGTVRQNKHLYIKVTTSW